MRVCILNEQNVCVNIIIADDLEFVQSKILKSGEKVSADHTGEIGWVFENGVWVDPYNPKISLEEKAQIAREKRRRLLKKNVDMMNPIRWEGMSQTERDKWIDYRQKLLDITLQEKFPEQIVWPELPQ